MLPAVVEEAASSNSSEAGDEDLAQMSKSISYMDARPRLDWIIDEGEMPKSKTVIV